jgi:A/G-specific adenine glycosylase
MRRSVKTASDRKAFARTLLLWYSGHQRRLPWRGEHNSYRIWISEVMLQQTRVAVVTERYRHFLRRFPTLQKLARSRLADVLTAWSGLGYYRRARALHAAAKIVIAEHAGVLPQTAESLRRLPGIGRYTAAAIASIAFNEPVALVDGNVERVLARVYGKPQADPWARATELLDRRRPGDFNQAMMELGATVCLPRRPLCGQCPIRRFCRAQSNLKQATNSRRHQQPISYALLRKSDSIVLVERSARASLMPEMWELPQLTHAPEQEPLLKLRHSITKTDYEVSVFAAPPAFKSDNARWVRIRNVEQLPLTGLARKILSRLQLLPG